MLLQFITETPTGPKERHLIRSHVMKGKNLGKPRPTRKRPVNIKSSTAKSDAVQSAPESPPDCWSDVEEIEALYSDHTLGRDWALWKRYKLNVHPRHMRSEAETYIYQQLWTVAQILYPPEFCAEIDLSQYIWYQYGIVDKTYFRCILAISSCFPYRFGEILNTAPEALQHMSHAYRLVNKRLSGPEACSDKSIASVAILAIWHRINHQQSAGLVHLGGLHRMVQMRGGLKKLAKENKSLAQKPWRLSLEFALQDGSRSKFELAETPVTALPALLKTVQRRVLTLGPGESLYGVGPEMSTLLVDVGDFTTLLNSMGPTNKIDPVDYQNCLCELTHRLLDYAPLGLQRPANKLDNMVHLALVSLMTTLMPEYTNNKRSRYILLAEKFRYALNSYAATVETADGNCELLLWALSIGYISVFESEDDVRWLTTLAGPVYMHLDLYSWTEVRSMLCQYGWICIYYDMMGMDFWSRFALCP